LTKEIFEIALLFRKINILQDKNDDYYQKPDETEVSYRRGISDANAFY